MPANDVAGALFVSDTPLANITGAFDIVVANILAEELVRMGPDLVQRVGLGGVLVLSGILAEKEEVVTSGFAGYNLELLEITREAEWSCISYLREL